MNNLKFNKSESVEINQWILGVALITLVLVFVIVFMTFFGQINNLKKELSNEQATADRLQATVVSQAKKIDILEEENRRSQTTINKQEETIFELEQVDVEKYVDEKMNRLLLELTSMEVNRTAYFIRNEILYHNTNEISREEAAYRALWYQSQGKKYFGENTYLPIAISIVENRTEHYDRDGVIVENHKNAIGAMQLTHWVETKYNIDATVLEDNITSGIRFVKHWIDIYEDIELGLAHYNGGSRPWDKIIEYPETKNYVEKVMKIYNTMEEKYGH